MDNQIKGQRGKKLCPKCISLVGVRTFLCTCGYSFPSKKTLFKKEVFIKNDVKQANPTEVALNLSVPVILGKRCIVDFQRPFRYINTPSGAWTKLNDFTENGINQWIDEITEEYFVKNKNCLLTKDAVLYLARSNNNVFSKEWQNAQFLIEDILSQRMSK